MLTHNKLASSEWSNVNTSPSSTYAIDLRLHWIFCNVYPQSQKTVKCKLEDFLKEFHDMRKVPFKKRGQIYWTRYGNFLDDSRQLFDIFADKQSIKKQEQMWDVRIKPADYEFYENLRKCPQIGYCTNFVCRKWEAANKEKNERKERILLQKKKAEEYKRSMIPVTSETYIEDDGALDDGHAGNDENDFSPQPKKAK